jgi:thioredoxin reductase (NADPH)
MTHATLEAAFPRLDEKQLERVASLAELVEFADGDALFEVGQPEVPMYVVVSGEAVIYECSSGTRKHVITHGPGEFTGDVDFLTGRPVIVSGIAQGNVRAYRVPHERMRRLLNEIPDLSDMLLEAFQLRRRLLEESGFLGIRLVGSARSKETMRLREFFYRNHVPHTFFDIADEDGQAQLRQMDVREDETPALACRKATVKRPSLSRVAECLGISRNVEDAVYDLLIIGAGPSGLAAAVYGGSEGLSTLVVDSIGPGGQAGSSSKIENFIGFPAGLSGTELANRGYLQSLKFGARFSAPTSVRSLERSDDGCLHAKLCSGQTAKARCVLVASGVSYRQLDIEGMRTFEGAGVYYAATTVEARVCRDSTAVVVGGGNSAGQAAMFLAQNAKQVLLVIRGDDLGKSMSSYLCQRIEHHPQIRVLKNSEVEGIEGRNAVEGARIKNRDTGETTPIECAAVFVFIGAQPNTDWLPDTIRRDDKGFVLTGAAVKDDELWPLDRDPCDLETTMPGVMAGGDVRSGTTKRCGFAVGDGSMAITCVHRYLSGLY